MEQLCTCLPEPNAILQLRRNLSIYPLFNAVNPGHVEEDTL